MTGARKVRLMGYWAGSPLGQNWPDPSTLVDHDWDADERAAVARYLRHGLLVRWLGHDIDCLLCGQRLASAEASDGKYLWPLGLEHYVAAHSVRLPQEFIESAHADADARGRWDIEYDWWRSATRA